MIRMQTYPEDGNLGHLHLDAEVEKWMLQGERFLEMQCSLI